jgi:hypothetical protein
VILIGILQLMVLSAILLTLLWPRKLEVLKAVQSVVESNKKIKPKSPKET